MAVARKYGSPVAFLGEPWLLVPLPRLGMQRARCPHLCTCAPGSEPLSQRSSQGALVLSRVP